MKSKKKNKLDNLKQFHNAYSDINGFIYAVGTNYNTVPVQYQQDILLYTALCLEVLFESDVYCSMSALNG